MTVSHLKAHHENTITHVIAHHKGLGTIAKEINIFKSKTVNKLNTRILKLICMRQVLNFALALGSVFLNIYIWRKTQSAEWILIYNFWHCLLGIVAFAVPIFFIKLKKKTVLQLGIILFGLLYFLLTLFKEFSLLNIILLGCINGLANGFFWVASHSIQYENTNDDNRDTFFALNSAFGSVITLLTPLIIGVIFALNLALAPAINISPYSVIFIITFIILAFSFWLSLKIQSEHFPHLNITDLFKGVKNKRWALIFTREFIDGLKGGTDGIIASLLIFFIVKNELKISILYEFSAILSIIVALYLSVTLNKKSRLKNGLIGSLLLIVAKIVFIKLFSIQGIIISGLIEIVATPLFALGLEATYYEAIDHSIKKKAEHIKFIFLREIPLNSGRILSILLLLTMLKNNVASHVTLLSGYYLVLGCIPLVYLTLTYLFEKSFKEIPA